MSKIFVTLATLTLFSSNLLAADSSFVCTNKEESKKIVISYSESSPIALFTVLSKDSEILGAGKFDTIDSSYHPFIKSLVISFINEREELDGSGVVQIALPGNPANSLNEVTSGNYDAKSDAFVQYGKNQEDSFEGSTLDCKVLVKN